MKMQAKGKERNKVSKQEQEVNLSQRIVCVLVLSAFVVEFEEKFALPLYHKNGELFAAHLQCISKLVKITLFKLAIYRNLLNVNETFCLRVLLGLL